VDKTEKSKRRVPIWLVIVGALLTVIALASIFGGGDNLDNQATEPTATEDVEGLPKTTEPVEEITPQAPAESENLGTATNGSAVLRMAVTDETSSGISDNFEVWVQGTGSWFYALDSLIEEAGPFPTDEPSSFFIYPEGRDGNEIQVQLFVPSTVNAGSAQDMIEIVVSDSEITIFGTSVPNTGGTYRR